MIRRSMHLSVMVLVTLVFALATADAQTKRAEIVTGEPVKPTKSFDEWVEEIKNPTEWWSWGADLRLRHISMFNPTTLTPDAARNERHFQRYRIRWWNQFTPMENLEANLRLTWEARTYPKPDQGTGALTYGWQDWYGGTVVWDHVNFKLKQVADLPIDLTVGRQDLIFGNGWLILDGTPLDGSRTIYFDAVRATWKPDEANTIDAVFIQQSGQDDGLFHPFNDIEEDQIEQDERGAILYWTNKSLEKTQVDGYFIYKHMEPLPQTFRKAGGALAPWQGDRGDIYTLGARAVHEFNDNWQLRAEGAYQFGEKERYDPSNPFGAMLTDGSLSAFGFNSRLTYFFHDEWKTQIRGSYEYLSGDDPSTAQDEQFDPLWGRWPQFSELYIYTYAIETRIAETTNLHRLGIGGSIFPTDKLEFCLDYHYLLADENSLANVAPATFSSNGDERGHLIAALCRYKINKHMFGHLVGEVFFPGDYYTDARDSTATFLRAELSFRW
jgi:hypothetical protein